MGIEVDFFVTDKDDKSITEEQMYKFMDDFIELVEKHGWLCGGGVNLKDADEDPKLSELLAKRKSLMRNCNMIVKEYREKRRTASKKEINEIKKRYEIAREFIYYCEDMIAEISPEELDDVVEPNPEDIDDALNLFSDYEWENMK